MSHWLLENLLIVGILVASVALSCRVGRFRPAVCHTLWLLVLIKLLTPPVSIRGWPPAAVTEGLRTLTAPLLEPDRKAVLATAVGGQPDAEEATATRAWSDVAVGPSPPAVAKATDAEEVVPSSAWRRLGFAAVVVWMAGALLVLARHVHWLIRCGRLLRENRRVPSALSRAVADVARRMQMRPPRLRRVRGTSAPCIVSLGQATLLWPESLECESDAKPYRGVLAHELAHLRRKDHWVAWLELVAQVVWWWNPLYWVIRHQLRLYAELACDNWAIWMQPDARREYADALLQSCAAPVCHTAVVPVVGWREPNGRQIERRLTMIMCESFPRRVPVLIMLPVCAAAMLLFPSWTAAAGTDEPLVRQYAASGSGTARFGSETKAVAGDQCWTAMHEGELELSALIRELHLSTMVGSLRISAGDSDKLLLRAVVGARKEVVDESQVGGGLADHVEVAHHGDVLVIRSRHRTKPEPEGWLVSIEVQLPRVLDLKGETLVGDILVEGYTGSLALTTIVGDIRLEKVRGSITECSSTCTTGNVVMAVARDFSAEVVRLSTVVGDVTVTLPGGSSGRFELETPQGELDVPATESFQFRRGSRGASATGTLGDGVPRYVLKTNVGDIALKAR